MARKGLPKSIIKKYGISKKAWRIYRGKKKPRSRVSNPKTKRRVKRTARKKRRRSSGFTIPLAPIAGLAVGMLKPIEEAMKGNINGVVAHVAMNYTGCDPNKLGRPDFFQIQRAANGILPLVIGLLVHKFVGGAPLNLNRMLARAKVPFIRI